MIRWKILLNLGKHKRFMKYIFLLLSTFLLSCARESDCSLGGLNIAITNLDSKNNDTILIQKFDKNTSFKNRVDSTLHIFKNSEDSLNNIHGDTVLLNGILGFFPTVTGSDKNNMGFLSARYDYILKTKNHSYQFTGLEIAKKTKKCGGLLSLDCPDCYSPVVTFNLNNSKHQITENELFYIPN